MAFVGDAWQIAFVDEYVPGSFPQSGAFAARTGAYAQKLLQIFPHHGRIRLVVPAFHIRQHAFKLMSALDDIAAIINVAEVDPFPAAAVENGVFLFLFQLVEGRFNVETVVLGDR